MRPTLVLLSLRHAHRESPQVCQAGQGQPWAPRVRECHQTTTARRPFPRLGSREWRCALKRSEIGRPCERYTSRHSEKIISRLLQTSSTSCATLSAEAKGFRSSRQNKTRLSDT